MTTTPVFRYPQKSSLPSHLDAGGDSFSLCFLLILSGSWKPIFNSIGNPKDIETSFRRLFLLGMYGSGRFFHTPTLLDPVGHFANAFDEGGWEGLNAAIRATPVAKLYMFPNLATIGKFYRGCKSSIRTCANFATENGENIPSNLRYYVDMNHAKCWPSALTEGHGIPNPCTTVIGWHTRLAEETRNRLIARLSLQPKTDFIYR